MFFNLFLNRSVFRFLIVFPLFFFGVKMAGQVSAYERYIDTYSDMAVEQMERYGIPASITLAQGLLESGAGQSFLAKKANNHFGIKVGSSWSGPYVKHDDDARNERFRKYTSVKHSYEDHSKFLVHGARYAFLFELEKTDYKRWAEGLKKAGYATNPRYAQQLIDLIERYRLYRYDDVQSRNVACFELKGYQLGCCNESYYVRAKKGDTFKTLSKVLNVSKRKLSKYNELPKDYVFEEGELVYITKKQKKAAKVWKGQYHVVKENESLHDIAQMYGVRLQTLYRINQFDEHYTLQVGSSVLIR
ncbi:MAG: glucosaminidase domain-containing protein [Bacteroidaceae bacterium]|nr:glucosaminidase domain-containing protein [Bacteroidaceae bacterium]